LSINIILCIPAQSVSYVREKTNYHASDYLFILLLFTNVHWLRLFDRCCSWKHSNDNAL